MDGANAPHTGTLRLSRTTNDGVTGTFQWTSQNGALWVGTMSGTVSLTGMLLTGQMDSPLTATFGYTAQYTSFSASLTSTGQLTGTYSQTVMLNGEPDVARVDGVITGGSR